jgi:hypothetical protein
MRSASVKAGVVVLFVAAYIAATLTAAMAAVKSASSDGEATVYLMADFTKSFDIAYRVTLKPAAHNKSWSSVSILLVGRQIPGAGASLGIISDPPSHTLVHSFTYVVYPNLKGDYNRQSGRCLTGCLIELRGDQHSIYAYVNDSLVASWSRSDLYLQHPHIQLNAEVHGVGDSIYAVLIPVRTVVADRTLPHPTCAFTTRGIEPAGLTALKFRGKANDAGGAFINLLTGIRGDKC